MKIIRIWALIGLVLTVISCSNKEDGNQEVVIIDDSGQKTTVNVSLNRKATGDSASDILSGSQYDSIVFEIFYVEGMAPTEITMADFEQFVSNRVNKTKGLEIKLKEIPSTGISSYTVSDIAGLEEEVRTEYNSGSKLAIFGVFVDGSFAGNDDNGSVLGIAYRNTSFVIFEETVRGFSNSAFAPKLEVLETVVTEHEFGHLMGLVNVGSPMQNEHQDTAHGHHCNDDTCLMFWSAETGEGLLDIFLGGSVPELDPHCLEDLRANGGK